MDKDINILHLSDIHFGIEPTKDGLIDSDKVAERQLVLRKLICKLKDIKLQWKPNIIVVSGDIGWSGKSEDYKEAKVWLKETMRCLSITSTHLVICPGNHDLDRNEAKFIVKAYNNEEADNYLNSENISRFMTYFKNYEEFAKDIGIQPYNVGSNEGFLSGTIIIDKIRFIVLNSAWFSSNNDDRGKLWIGLPQLKILEANEQIVENDEYINIGVVHHPNEWLSEGEIHSYGQRMCTYDYLAKMTHLILSGHVHANPKKSDIIAGSSHLVLGGSTYSGGNYNNNCSIIKINKEKMTMERTLLEYKPNDGEWVVNYGYEEQHLKKKV